MDTEIGEGDASGIHQVDRLRGLSQMHKPSESDRYDEHHFQTSCGVPYERSEHWLSSFSQIAKRVIQMIDPRTVLDAGCAKRLLNEVWNEGEAPWKV